MKKTFSEKTQTKKKENTGECEFSKITEQTLSWIRVYRNIKK